MFLEFLGFLYHLVAECLLTIDHRNPSTVLFLYSFSLFPTTVLSNLFLLPSIQEQKIQNVNKKFQTKKTLRGTES